MSGILKRTIYYYPGDSQYTKKIRFHDWADVITSIGVCVEMCPDLSNWFPGAGISDIDVTVTGDGIDEIKPAGRDRMERFIVDEENVALHGGLCWPRKRPI